MTGLPVEVNIGLTSLTFADVFETTVEVHIARYFGYQIDVLYAFHTLEHVLLVHHDLFLARGEVVLGVAGTVGRLFERHLDGNGSVAGTCVAVGELRLILVERIHLRYLYAEIVDSCAQRLDSICYAEISPTNAGARDDRHYRLIHHLHLQLHRLLEVLNRKIELIRIDTRNHALRDSVDNRLACSKPVVTFGQTGRRAVERLTGLQVHRTRADVGNRHLSVLVESRIFELADVHFPPSSIPLSLGSLRVPLQDASVLTGLVEIS